MRSSSNISIRTLGCRRKCSIRRTATRSWRSETKRIDGIVVRANALRIAAYLYLQSLYQRENVQIGCEYEGDHARLGHPAAERIAACLWLWRRAHRRRRQRADTGPGARLGPGAVLHPRADAEREVFRPDIGERGR